jgi:hypothetical protein
MRKFLCKAAFAWTTMSFKIFATLISLLFFISANAIAQGPFASEVDLKAGYCVATVRAGAGEITEEMRKHHPSLVELRNKRNVQLSNLRRYLLLRSQSMNSAALGELSAAMSAGEEAYKRFRSTIDSCLDEVLQPSEPVTDATARKLDACRVRKQGETELRRIENCFSLDFLPY